MYVSFEKVFAEFMNRTSQVALNIIC